jgi:hypothetical protein
VIFLSCSFLLLGSEMTSGYTFWTNNKDYLRLSGLYSMIFDKKYRANLAKDGICQYLYAGKFLISLPSGPLLLTQ